MLTINENFAGYGTISLALRYEGIPFKIVGITEIEKNAIKAYKTLHGDVKNYGDISKIGMLDYADFWSYSSPCQSFSLAGKQAGGDKGSNTESSLLWEVERLLLKAKETNTLPKYLMLENVKNLLGPKHIHNFEKWLCVLEDLGYNNYYNILNSSDFGIPQRRERVFCVSIRKDIDDGLFKMDLEKLLPLGAIPCGSFKNYLEKNIVDDIYLNANHFSKMKDFGAPYGFGGSTIYGDIYSTITASYGLISGNSAKFIRNEDVLVETLEGVKVAQRSILTPREAMLLMGVNKEDAEILYNLFDNKKILYKLAGNSIVVDVMRVIFRNLFNNIKKENTITKGDVS